MKTSRLKLSALLLGGTLLFASCGEQGPTAPPAPVAPAAAPQASLLGDIGQLGGSLDGLLADALKKLGLLKCTPLPTARTSKVIGSAGGTIEIGPHTFTVPAGALKKNVTISAVSPSDNVNRVHFEPEGLKFDKPASLTMSYANCNLLGILLPKHIAYVDDDLRILYYLLSVDNLLAKKVTGQVDHFSEYAAAW